jgi:AcrR family transcriptional regulator
MPVPACTRKKGFFLNVRSDTVTPMARTTGSHSDITGPRIQDAALKLFARHGFAAVSMRQIAAEVGVQAGALYNYTPDKQSLLFGLMARHLEALLETRKAQASSGDPMNQLRDFVRFHIRFHLERPDEVFIAYMELRNLTPENFTRIEALRGAYEDQLEDTLNRGVAQGVFAVPDTKIATLAIIAMLTGVNTWYRTGGRLSLDQVEAIYWDMVRKSVAA